MALFVTDSISTFKALLEYDNVSKGWDCPPTEGKCMGMSLNRKKNNIIRGKCHLL
jgi:hypothetical protein